MIPYSWTALESERVRKVKYIPNEHDARGDLLVEFTTGKTYRYLDVPQHKVEHMVHSSSPGRSFHDRIRGEHAAIPLRGDE